MARSPLFDWRKLFSSGADPASIPDLEASLAKVKTMQAEATAELSARVAKRQEMLLTATDDEVKAFDQQTGEIGLKVARCGAGVEDLTGKLAGARATAAEAGRRALYDEAAAKAEAAQDALRTVYPEVVTTLRGLLRQVAEAEIAVAAANADRPEGAPKLDGPEDFRLGASRDEVVSTRRVQLWADGYGAPLPSDLQAKVVDEGGHGSIPGGTAKLRKLAFAEETFVQRRSASYVDRLSTQLTLSPPATGDRPGWDPIRSHPTTTPLTLARITIGNLDEDEQRAAPPHEPKIRLRLLDKVHAGRTQGASR